ncbi:MAG: hypothetical protein RMJ67_10115, partial [Elusimicrobiota bacterium]|nr:phage tail tape measure protein [Endomicrobiia bacterium]MDW8166846.1 hypothetical protein [Elusimicrobiota bacterium]
GTVIAASFSVAITNFIKASDEIDKMSKRTGLGVETLQELKYAADITGTSIGDLEIGIKMMQNAITDAANGSKSAIEKFDKLGINFEKIKNLSPEQQFMVVADAISKIQDPTERAAMAVDMFGRSGTQLLPLLEGGASGIQKLRDEAHIFGKVLDEETISKTVDLKDNIERLQYSFNALWSEISVNMLPIVEDLVKRIQSVISDVRN